jgi:hypothetical protein
MSKKGLYTTVISVAVVVISIILISLMGYIWTPVGANEFAITTKNGVTIDNVVGPGRYTDLGFRASIHVIDGQAQTLTWYDNELLTLDRQSVGFEVSVTYARDMAHAEKIWTEFRASAQDDVVLAALVESRLPRVVKAVTSSMSLDAMLEKTEIQAILRDRVAEEMQAIGLRLIDIGINKIRPTETYLELLEQRATIAAEEELEQRRNANALARIERERLVAQSNIELAIQQLELEQAETEIALELARREALVAMEEAEVFSMSPEALQIRLAEIYAEALAKAGAIYLPSDVNLNIFDGAAVIGG